VPFDTLRRLRIIAPEHLEYARSNRVPQWTERRIVASNEYERTGNRVALAKLHEWASEFTNELAQSGFDAPVLSYSRELPQQPRG
jgi:hypothetical protein